MCIVRKLSIPQKVSKLWHNLCVCVVSVCIASLYIPIHTSQFSLRAHSSLARSAGNCNTMCVYLHATKIQIFPPEKRASVLKPCKVLGLIYGASPPPNGIPTGFTRILPVLALRFGNPSEIAHLCTESWILSKWMCCLVW